MQNADTGCAACKCVSLDYFFFSIAPDFFVLILRRISYQLLKLHAFWYGIGVEYSITEQILVDSAGGLIRVMNCYARVYSSNPGADLIF